ncbi:DTW domain-containing protein [Achromobacter sp. GG226]|uniref:tRNA-uridine aminocarboxypropyltransferase n=1 Tax=Verticiella alkaliphila TaxID=2779529 RepID=UPI001C0DDBF0|nr:tRNA-uridine aminocarboxypropyltransferase [Verticiella sp. GG226]MBU4611003.1 DTW domain-containing protein [Verticiella sp. GG226]
MARSRCARCTRPAGYCVCAHIPRLRNRTRVLVLQHPDEARHPLNTARLAVLGLANADLHVGEAFDARLWLDTPSWLLFPGDDACVLSPGMRPADPPAQLVVPDGTWRHARRLLRTNPSLLTLPRCAPAPGAASAYTVRRAAEPGALATIEAIAATLQALDAPMDATPLLRPFAAMVQAQLDATARAAATPD